jgi:hypothetical protein
MATRHETAKPRVPRYSELEKPERKLAYPAAKQVAFSDVVGRDLKIVEFQKRPSKYREGDIIVVHAYNRTLNEQPPFDVSFSTGASVVIQKLEELQQARRLPVIARIVQPQGKKYYVLE